MTLYEIAKLIVIFVIASGIIFVYVYVVMDELKLKKLMAQRTKGREPLEIEFIYRDVWDGLEIDYENFAVLWKGAAECFVMQPELMRPEDLIDDLFVSTRISGTNTGDYLADFFEDHMPGCNPFAELDRMESETVRDLINSCIARQRNL